MALYLVRIGKEAVKMPTPCMPVQGGEKRRHCSVPVSVWFAAWTYSRKSSIERTPTKRMIVWIGRIVYFSDVTFIMHE
jgi:hypothetical protein